MQFLACSGLPHGVSQSGSGPRSALSLPTCSRIKQTGNHEDNWKCKT